MPFKPNRPLSVEDTYLETWFERDRAHVDLRRKSNDKTIVEWWDGAVHEAVEDGFLDPRDYHASAFEYAEDHGLLRRRTPCAITSTEEDDE